MTGNCSQSWPVCGNQLYNENSALPSSDVYIESILPVQLRPSTPYEVKAPRGQFMIYRDGVDDQTRLR